MCHNFIRELVEEKEEDLEHMENKKFLDRSLTKALSDTLNVGSCES